MTLTAYQVGALAGLKMGAPAIASLYEFICKTPGASITEIKDATGKTNVSTRLVKLERARLVRSEVRRVHGRNFRLVFPLEAP